MANIEENVKKLLTEIPERNPQGEEVTLVAAVKMQTPEDINRAIRAGVRAIGDNHVQEFKQKYDLIEGGAERHFIGHLQSNKAAKVVKYFDVIQSVDSLKLARIISKEACLLKKREKILLQVNNAGEEQKSGYTKEALKNDLGEILKLEGLDVIGLMNIAPLGADKDTLHKLFKDIRDFRDSLEEEFKIQLPELSMGMSDDYETALKEGATIIRIGRKLFIK